MTSRIRVCPQCHLVGQHQDLPERTAARLLDLVAVTDRPPAGWTMMAGWCGQCNTPYLVLWPEKVDLLERIRLAGYPDESPHLLPNEGET